MGPSNSLEKGWMGIVEAKESTEHVLQPRAQWKNGFVLGAKEPEVPSVPLHETSPTCLMTQHSSTINAHHTAKWATKATEKLKNFGVNVSWVRFSIMEVIETQS